MCGLCDEACDTIASLRSHLKSHEQIPQLDGNEDNRSQLDFSVILPDGFGRFIPGTWYKCKVCDFQSTCRDDLEKHENKKNKQIKSNRRKPRQN